ncbi:histone acetyltransferase type B catalytic subunit [Ditylenchus destructor]|uniref:Histone acetyltransferase type B catalytic subunit n=1 Tax=Ditylenchus destructor TaxID=166010 RepID=A0AAD4QUR4_9BILA|nr:histone acetyltransferase type B catalytic subunit [Ditylenchus destructor]
MIPEQTVGDFKNEIKTQHLLGNYNSDNSYVLTLWKGGQLKYTYTKDDEPLNAWVTIDKDSIFKLLAPAEANRVEENDNNKGNCLHAYYMLRVPMAVSPAWLITVAGKGHKSTLLIQEDILLLSRNTRRILAKFGSINDMKLLDGHEPWYVHNHFSLDNSEERIDFTNLEVAVCFAQASLDVHVEIFNRNTKEVDNSERAHKIACRIKDQLKLHPHITPELQFDVFVDKMQGYQKILDDQESFQPLGTLVADFTFGDGSRRAEMYRAERIHKKVLNNSDKSANHQLQVYLAKSQSMAFWFIGQLAYMNDELINSQGQPSFHYFLYEVKEQSPRYTFLGYASLYVPEKYFNSARIGHLMLSPPYTHSGIGSKFLDAIYGDLLKDDKVEYITIEKPAERLKLVRNFTDCRNLLKMPEFSRSEILDTDVITEDMKAAAKKIKLEKNQYEKAFQIIRLYYLSGDQENFPGNLSDKDRNLWNRHGWVVKRLQKFVGMPHWSPIREPPPMVFEEDQEWSLPDELPECYVRRTLYEDMKPRAENEPTQRDQVVPIELRMCSRQLTRHIAHYFSKLGRLHVRKQKTDQITESIKTKVEAKIPETRKRYTLRSMTPSPYVFTRGLNNN